MNDGLLDLMIMRGLSRMGMVKALQAAEKEGMHVMDKECSYYRCREIKVEVHSPDKAVIEMEMDGEDFWCSEAIFSVNSELVEIIY